MLYESARMLPATPRILIVDCISLFKSKLIHSVIAQGKAIRSIRSGSFSFSSWAAKRSKKVCQAVAKRRPLAFVRRL